MFTGKLINDLFTPKKLILPAQMVLFFVTLSLTDPRTAYAVHTLALIALYFFAMMYYFATTADIESL